jgi:hypothetical protein
MRCLNAQGDHLRQQIEALGMLKERGQARLEVVLEKYVVVSNTMCALAEQEENEHQMSKQELNSLLLPPGEVTFVPLANPLGTVFPMR